MHRLRDGTQYMSNEADLLESLGADDQNEDLLHMEDGENSTPHTNESGPQTPVVTWPQNIKRPKGKHVSPGKKSSPVHTNNLYDDAFRRQAKLDERRFEQAKLETAGLFQPNLVTSGKKKSRKSRTHMLNKSLESGSPAHPSTPDAAPKEKQAKSSPHLRMFNRSQQIQTKKQELIRKQHELEAAMNTFKPQIYTSPGHRAGKMKTETSGNVFERLDRRAEQMRKKKEEFAKELTEQQCSFSPNVNKKVGKTGVKVGLRRLSLKDDKAHHTPNKVNTKELTSRLYNLKHLEEVAKRKEQLKIEYETKDCTYHPKVAKPNKDVTYGVTTTSLSLNLDHSAEYTGSHDDMVPHPDEPPPAAPNSGSKQESACLRLYDKASSQNKQFEAWREDAKTRNLTECTFSPNLSESAKKVHNKLGLRVAKNVFERLQQKEKKIFYREEDPNLTFKPKILEKTIVDPDSELAALTHMPLEERFDRLYQQGVERIEKKRMLPKDEEAALRKKLEDKELKQCTFKPRTTWKKVFGHSVQSYDGDMEGIESFEFTENTDDLDFGDEEDFEEERGDGESEEGLEEEVEGEGEEEEGEVTTGLTDILGEMREIAGSNIEDEGAVEVGGDAVALAEENPAFDLLDFNYDDNYQAYESNSPAGGDDTSDLLRSEVADPRLSENTNEGKISPGSIDILGGGLEDHEFHFGDDETQIEFDHIKDAEHSSHHDFPAHTEEVKVNQVEEEVNPFF